jgi:hypothetical protein
MNRHGEKLDYAGSLDDPSATDPDLGGILYEAHTCPECGKMGTRQAR